MGIQTVEQLRMAPGTNCQGSLEIRSRISQAGSGIDHRKVEPYTEAKSISAEEPSQSISSTGYVIRSLNHQVEEVGQRLRAEKLQARTITLKIRYGDFRTITGVIQ